MTTLKLGNKMKVVPMNEKANVLTMLNEAFTSNRANLAISAEYESDYEGVRDSFKEFPASSHCGKHCAKVIAKAKEFMEMIDPAAHNLVVQATVCECGVICFG